MIVTLYLWFFAQLSPEQIKHIDEMAQKDFKWWFAFIFILFVSSGMWIYRQQSKQLSEQRTAHQETLNLLIKYLHEDRIQGINAISTFNQTTGQFTSTLQQLQKFLADVKFVTPSDDQHN